GVGTLETVAGDRHPDRCAGAVLAGLVVPPFRYLSLGQTLSQPSSQGGLVRGTRHGSHVLSSTGPSSVCLNRLSVNGRYSMRLSNHWSTTRSCIIAGQNLPTVHEHDGLRAPVLMSLLHPQMYG